MTKTTIEWTEYSWNPIRGTKGNWHCTKVSPGCTHCYAERVNIRFGGPAYTVGADTLRLDEKALAEPLRWRKPRMVFVCSMTDLFHESLDFVDIAEVFRHMQPPHTYQVLTKRPERIREFLEWIKAVSSGQSGPVLPWPLFNVWIGVSAENQEQADKRIPILLSIPAAVRWVSIEPMLGPVDLRCKRDSDHDGNCDRHPSGCPKLDWVVVGGESGPEARPMDPLWARGVRDQCVAADVPFFFKQWGEWAPDCLCGMRKPHPHIRRPGMRLGVMFRCGKKAAGRILDGRKWSEYPQAVSA